MTDETTPALGILRDMKNLGNEELSKKLCEPEKVVDDLDPTENGETSEKAHSSSN